LKSSHFKEITIISGGQTGADRAALDWALKHGIPHGGWCPRGRRSESGRIPERYRLKETPRQGYSQRTEWNIRDSDGTVVFSLRPVLRGGSRLTLRLTKKKGKPVLHIFKTQEREADAQLTEFIRKRRIKILNVAGPRASEEPRIGTFVKKVLSNTLRSGSGKQPHRPNR
jgi:hypothetical protein